MSCLSISEINALSSEQFAWMFENVIELCPDAAVQVERRRPFKSVEDLCAEFHRYLDGLGEEGQLVILKLHPDLAGQLAGKGQLTRESTEEQRSAGLHQLTSDQSSTIQLSNERYKSKFGFPFIICARENKLQSIIKGLQQRYYNNREQEIFTGIEEVKKICRIRVLDIVKQ